MIFDLHANKRLGSRAVAHGLNRRGHRTKGGDVVELSLCAGLPVDLGLGTIDACDGTCSVEVGGIPLLSAITVDGAGDLWHAELPGVVTSP